MVVILADQLGLYTGAQRVAGGAERRKPGGFVAGHGTGVGGGPVAPIAPAGEEGAGEESVAAVAEFVARLRPATAYLAVPTRPPAEPWVQIPAEESIARAYQIFHDRVAHLEYLIGYEGDAFAWSSDVVRDLLSITAVHPMREEAVEALLERAGGDWSLVHTLIAQGQLVETTYAGHRFYLRRLRGPTIALAEN